MTIIFLCGSLEPGSDGVGDYIRKLSAAMFKKGHMVAAIALNDRQIQRLEEGHQTENNVQIPVLRIPSLLPHAEKFMLASGFIEKWNPDWLSLQFVPYAFNEKGIPFGWARKLKQLGGKRSWHIMYHELWVGVDGRLTTKNTVVKYLQQFIIHNLNRILRPKLLTSSIPVYLKQLDGYPKQLLPLFGNIKVTNHNADQLESPEWKVLHFGSFTGHEKELRNQFDWLQKIAHSNRKTVKFIVAGGGGPFKQMALQLAKEIFGEQHVFDKGKLQEEEISQLMNQADLGISRADHLMYGKSGSTMALLEHGLPVLLRGSHPSLPLPDEGLFFADDPIEKLPQKKEPNRNKVNEIASLLLKFLGH